MTVVEWAIIENALSAAGVSALYGMIVYLRHYTRDGEAFEPANLLSTVLVAVLVGGAIGASGGSISLLAIEERLAAYAGVVVLVEQFLKLLRDALEQRGRK